MTKARKLFLDEYPEAGAINFERAWAGYIDYMPDELPVIDMPINPSGLVIAAGLSGNGFGLGPIGLSRVYFASLKAISLKS